MKKLLSKIMWFEKRNKFDIDFFDILMPQRTVSEDPRYKSGLFFSEKCNRHIQYESGLELEFIKRLEKSKQVKFYWEQPVQVPYWRGRIKNYYTPDFALYLRTNEIVLVEIKTLPDMLDHRVQMKMEGLLKFCAQKGFGLLFTDGRNTIHKILKIKCNRKLERAILSSISANHVLRKKECREIVKSCNATQNELLKIIAKNNLKFRSFASRIEPTNRNGIFRHVFIEKKPYDDFLADEFSTLFKRVC